ncbi:MAG: acyl carrier protein [Paludibacteraceae bacterium]|nr:acyl carrier protein [Paludibacteraceae bacterium]
MKANILSLLTDALPAVDFESDFLFSELDSLGIATIIVLLAKEYNISLDATDVTPKNFKTIDAIVNMVASKIEQK